MLVRSAGWEGLGLYTELNQRRENVSVHIRHLKMDYTIMNTGSQNTHLICQKLRFWGRAFPVLQILLPG